MDDKYALIWKIRYAMRFGRRQARLLDRVARCMKLLTFAAGTTAFASVIGDSAWLTQWSGLAVAVLAIIDGLWNPSALAARSREMEAKFAILNGEASSLPTETLQKRMDHLYESELPEIESLRPIVYNDVIDELGSAQSERFTLTRWQRMVEAAA